MGGGSPWGSLRRDDLSPSPPGVPSMQPCSLSLPPVSTSPKQRDGCVSQGRVLEAGIEGEQGDTPSAGRLLGKGVSSRGMTPRVISVAQVPDSTGQLQAGSGLPAATLAGPKGRRQASQKTRRRSDQTSAALAMAQRECRGAPGGCARSRAGAPQWRLSTAVRLCVETQRSTIPACSHLRPHSPPRSPRVPPLKGSQTPALLHQVRMLSSRIVLLWDPEPSFQP